MYNQPSIAQVDRRRKHKLLTAELIKQLPALYAQDGKGEDAIVHVKLFTPSSDMTWYITEYDPKANQAFGLIVVDSMRDQCPKGEYGYICITELATYQMGGMPMVERDKFFNPCTLGEVRKKLDSATIAT